ncbi:homeobox protein Meis1a [Lates japonicus]|uniref:Homeobox protein Meis1a n=1 Tax=Lates japonicus TaxID=270547 RepID=A0AAD3NFU5_LATJO|nr:homeobox protein Meis1a [Lates japonicus]
MGEETIPSSLPPPSLPSHPDGLHAGRRKPLLRSCDGDLNAPPRRTQRRTAPSQSAAGGSASLNPPGVSWSPGGETGPMAQRYEDLAHYGLDGMGGVYGDHHHHHHHAAAARSLQAVHLAAAAAAAAPYPPHQFSQSSHSSSDNMAATAGDGKRDKDAIYGHPLFPLL